MPDNCKIDLRKRGICVIVPTFNNAGTIEDIVRRTQVFCSDVFVVLDGCTDDTLSRLEVMPAPPRTVVLERNSGKGVALKEGFRRAREAGFSYAITIDADGQHYPEDIPLFLEANRRHPCSLIVGNRTGLEKAERSRGSKFANSFSNFWFFIQTLIPLKDTQTGYRLYPIHRLPWMGMITSRYEAELELLVLSAWRGVRIVSQDVRVYYPPKDERVSHFRPVYDFVRITILNVVLCLFALVYGLPRTILRFVLRCVEMLLLFVGYVFATAVLITPGAFMYLKCGKMTESKKEKLHEFICWISRKVLHFFGLIGNKYTLGGNVGEDFSRPAVIICNHQSHLDLLPMLALTPKLVILTADWVWHNPLYGFIIREADYLPASKGIETIAPRLGELMEKGYSVVVYPESTRSLDCRVGRFHQGAFYLADHFKADILPLVLYGTGHALPKHGRLLNRWPMLMEIDRRISHEEMLDYGDSLKSQASFMRKYYISRYNDIADKVEKTLK